MGIVMALPLTIVCTAVLLKTISKSEQLLIQIHLGLSLVLQSYSGHIIQTTAFKLLYTLC